MALFSPLYPPLISSVSTPYPSQMCVLLTPLISYFQGERPTRRVWLCAVISLLGACLIIFDTTPLQAATNAAGAAMAATTKPAIDSAGVAFDVADLAERVAMAGQSFMEGGGSSIGGAQAASS